VVLYNIHNFFIFWREVWLCCRYP